MVVDVEDLEMIRRLDDDSMILIDFVAFYMKIELLLIDMF